ncbi:galactokinase family protein [Pontibacter silvestris]|uniref:Galactokinase family protein n=1 Tax=Pontibacter silvestris TaxID=2305183 RepID=A0ABW4WUE8_9BACT
MIKFSKCISSKSDRINLRSRISFRSCTIENHCWFAPLKESLSGEYTDYIDGFILPAAIKKGRFLRSCS